MAKTDLKARPVFHHTRDSIEAHLTIVFAALAVSRTIQSKMGVSIKKLINTLEPLKTGRLRIGGKAREVEPVVSPAVKAILEKVYE